MLTKVEDISSVKKVLHIEIPEKDITAELNKTYNNIKKTASIKGFRKGKAPISIIEKMYGNDAKAETLENLVKETFSDAVTEKKMFVLGTPEIKGDDELKDNSSYAYTAVIEIRPEIGDINTDGLILKKKVHSIKDEQISFQLDMLQKRMAEYPAAEKEEAQEDDFVMISYEVFQDDEHLEEKDKDDFLLKIGDNSIDESFDKSIVGMKLQENKEITVTFPDDAKELFDPDFAGKTLLFKVALKTVNEESLPELNDDFAKKFGPSFNTLDELKDSIRKNLEEGYAKETEYDLNEQIFTALLEKVDFEVPEILIKQEEAGLIYDAEKYLSSYNFSEEEIEAKRKEMSGQFRETAEKQARRYIVLEKIVEQEKLKIEDEDLQKAYEDTAKMVGQGADMIKNYFESSPDKMVELKSSLIWKKALKHIEEKSQIEEEIVPIEKEEKTPEDKSENKVQDNEEIKE